MNDSDPLEDEIKKAMLELEAQGLVEIKSYNEKGDPVYGLTESGEEHAEQIRKQQSSKWN